MTAIFRVQLLRRCLRSVPRLTTVFPKTHEVV
jgi:hypothetical protein